MTGRERRIERRRVSRMAHRIASRVYGREAVADARNGDEHSARINARASATYGIAYWRLRNDGLD